MFASQDSPEKIAALWDSVSTHACAFWATIFLPWWNALDWNDPHTVGNALTLALIVIMLLGLLRGLFKLRHAYHTVRQLRINLDAATAREMTRLRAEVADANKAYRDDDDEDDEDEDDDDVDDTLDVVISNHRHATEMLIAANNQALEQFSITVERVIAAQEMAAKNLIEVIDKLAPDGRVDDMLEVIKDQNERTGRLMTEYASTLEALREKVTE